MLLGFTIALIAIISVVMRLTKGKASKKNDEPPVEETTEQGGKKGKKKNVSKPAATTQAQPAEQMSLKQLIKKENLAKQALKANKKVDPNHPDYFHSFKGFSAPITGVDIDNDRKFAVACALDNTFRVFKIPKNIDMKVEFPFTQQKIDFYQPYAISLSDSARYIAVAVDGLNSVQIYTYQDTPNREDEKSASGAIKLNFQFKNSIHKNQITRIFMNPKATFIVTAATGDDTMIKTWSLKGENLFNFNTSQLKTNNLTRSLDGRFLAVSTWASEGELLELKAGSDGTLKEFSKAMNLKGHKLETMDVAIDQKNERAVSLSKDKTIKLWNINVRYEVKEDTKVLGTLDLSTHEDFKELMVTKVGTLSLFQVNDDPLMAVSYKNEILIYSWKKQRVVQKIESAHVEGATISRLAFVEFGRNLTVTSSGDDARVNIWKVHTEY